MKDIGIINWTRVTWRNVRPAPSHKHFTKNTFTKFSELWSTDRQPLPRMSLSTERFLARVWISSRWPQRIVTYFTHAHTYIQTHDRFSVHKLETESSYSTLHILTSTYLYLDGIYYASQLTLCWLEYRFPLTKSLLAFHTGRQGTICRRLLLGFRTRRRISCTEIK